MKQKFSKKLEKEERKLEKAYAKYRQWEKDGNIRMMRYWTTRMRNLEEPLRVEANRRLEAVLKQGIGEKMGWYDKILSYISTKRWQKDPKSKKINTPFGVGYIDETDEEFFTRFMNTAANWKFDSKTGEFKTPIPEPEPSTPRTTKNIILSPRDAQEAYENMLVELQFLRQEVSTPSGVRKVLRKINETAYTDYGMSNEEFYKFWKWRQLNPVHEFFKYFPPSPKELRGSVGTMVVDLWNSGELERQMMQDYFDEYQRYLETQHLDEPEGLSTSRLIGKLDELYETVTKRRKY